MVYYNELKKYASYISRQFVIPYPSTAETARPFCTSSSSPSARFQRAPPSFSSWNGKSCGQRLRSGSTVVKKIRFYLLFAADLAMDFILCQQNLGVPTEGCMLLD